MSKTDEDDTSTNEETQATELEDIEVTPDEISGETEETDESKKNEEADTEQLDTEEKSEEDAEQDESVESKDDTEEASQDEEPKEEVTTSKEEQKRLNDLYAQKRIAEKQVKDEAKRQSQLEYLDAADDDQQLAVRQLQVDAYNNRVDFNKSKLESGIDRAVANIDLFSKGEPEVKQELLRAVDDFERIYVKYDQNGEPIQVTGDVYQYLTEKADSIRRIQDVGARQSKKDRNKATTRTTTLPSKTPKEVKGDPDLDAFAEEAKAY